MRSRSSAFGPQSPATPPTEKEEVAAPRARRRTTDEGPPPPAEEEAVAEPEPPQERPLRSRRSAGSPPPAPEPEAAESEPEGDEAEEPVKPRGAGRAAEALAEIPDTYAPIVETIFSLESPETLFEQAERAIRPIKASQSSYGVLVDALDKSQDVARLAMQLLVNAKITAAAFERDTSTVVATFRDAASADLDRDKREGTRTKTITEADVLGRVATMFPEDWATIQLNRDKIKRMVDYLEDLHERAKERAKDLRAMVTKTRE